MVRNNSEERIKYINQLTDNVARSRYKNVDYDFINKMANFIINNVKLPRSRNQFNEPVCMKTNQIINVVREFYKTIDEDLYNKINDVLNGNDEKVDFKIINEKQVPKDYDPSIYISPDGTQKIQLLMGETACDAITLAHELAHTLDVSSSGPNLSRIKYSEITSICIEKMFLNYLKEHNIFSKQDIESEKYNQLARIVYASQEYSIKYALFDIKNKTGNITEQDVERVFRNHNVSYVHGVEILKNHNQDLHHNSKYIVAGIASEQFEELYNKDKAGAIKKFKQYIELIKKDKAEEALNVIEVDFKMDSLKQLINRKTAEMRNR